MRPPRTGSRPPPGHVRLASASRMPGSARIGPIEITGLDGPITIASACRSASRTASLGRASRAPQLHALHRPARSLDDHELLEGQRCAHARPPRCHRLVGHRQHAGAPRPSPRPPRLSLGQRPSRPQALGAHEAHGEVAVAEAEPVRPGPRPRAPPSPSRCRRAGPSRARRSRRPASRSRGRGRGRREPRRRPRRQPVLATTQSSPATSARPRASLAPPVPPESRTTSAAPGGPSA